MSIAERIESARAARGLSQSEVARRVGVTRGACGQWERGTSTPSVENLARLAALLEVRFEWLATGRGVRDYTPGTGEDSPPQYAELAADERKLLALYARLPAGSRSKLIEFLRALVPNGTA